MILTVASGKGGTGKTLISTSLALSLGEDAQFLDCDVEEPNGYIFLKPEIERSVTIYLPKPKVDIKRCSFCGRCRSACHYNAISVIKPGNKTTGKVLFFYELCHSCGACTLVCPENAIYEEKEEKGSVEIGTARGIFSFIQGKLKIAEASPVPVVKAVKKYIRKDKVNIIDASPGTSCPVVEAVKGADFCILVTEPTPFGLNDLALALEMTGKIGVPSGIIINRAGIGDNRVEDYAREKGIPVLLHIPFKREIAVSYSKGIPLVGIFSEYVSIFKKVFERIKYEILKHREVYE
ncbi:MAG: ATP-binding protein [Candidatus Omnitrophica bacterium]|nr:ATP-binding protein [Candidatus Omnitrophota bacterium]